MNEESPLPIDVNGVVVFKENAKAKIIAVQMVALDVIMICEPCNEVMQNKGPDQSAAPNVMFLYVCGKCGKGMRSPDNLPRRDFIPMDTFEQQRRQQNTPRILVPNGRPRN
jgi:hypothetical protein